MYFPNDYRHTLPIYIHISLDIKKHLTIIQT